MNSKSPSPELCRMTARTQRPSCPASTAEDLKLQLVTLSLEIEDRSRAAELLRVVAEKENERYDNLPKRLEEAYGKKMEGLTQTQSQDLRDKLEEVDKLLQAKRGMSEKCRQFLQEIEEEESETSKEISMIKERNAEKIKKTQAAWGKGEVSRRDKWIAKKTEEIRERTLKGLEPEIQRLVEQHNSEILDLENRHQEEERALREEMRRILEEKLNELQAKQKKKLNRAKDKELDEQRARLSKMMDDHQQHLHRLRGKMAAEKETLRQQNIGELRRYKEDHGTEITRLQTSQQEQLKTLRGKFGDEKESMIRHHNAIISNYKEQATCEREQWEEEMRKTILGERELHTEKERLKLTKMRDAEIEKSINILNQDTALFLKRTKTNTERAIQDSSRDFEEQRRQILADTRDLTGRYQEEVSKQHQLAEELAKAKGILQEKTNRLDLFQAELLGLKAKMNEKEEETRKVEESMQAKQSKTCANLKAEKEKVTSQIEASKEEIGQIQEQKAKAMKEIDRSHEATLENIHQDVKLKVEQIDGEVAKLRDTLETEKVRKDHLESVLQKYKASSHTSY